MAPSTATSGRTRPHPVLWYWMEWNRTPRASTKRTTSRDGPWSGGDENDQQYQCTAPTRTSSSHDLGLEKLLSISGVQKGKEIPSTTGLNSLLLLIFLFVITLYHYCVHLYIHKYIVFRPAFLNQHQVRNPQSGKKRNSFLVQGKWSPQLLSNMYSIPLNPKRELCTPCNGNTLCFLPLRTAVFCLLSSVKR